MLVEQLYTKCLAEAAYYIESNGEAAIIDPLRETEPYLNMLNSRGAKLKYIFETHFHADFVSGHLDLSKQTGAPIVFGPEAHPEFETITAVDGQEFKLGDITIKVLHTPGHTLESSTFLLLNKDGKEEAIFTGDTLFLGDVGRPDLAIKSDLTERDLAGMLYDSLRNKIMPLPDSVVVYPAHGAGSSCGKKLSDDTMDNLGNQKKTNYALRENMTKEEFIEEVLDGILPPPAYFPLNAMLNKQGYANIDEVIEKGQTALSVSEFESQINDDVLILDTRSPKEFAESHIPNSIFIGIDGSFAMWVGAVIKNVNQKILFIADEGREKEVVTRLSRVGFDQSLGYLKGGLEAWKKAGNQTDSIESVDPELFTKNYSEIAQSVVDVRKNSEYASSHLKDAIFYPLDYLQEDLSVLNKDQKYYVHCAGGYRSLIAISILKKNGIKNLVNINNGFNGFVSNGLPMESGLN